MKTDITRLPEGTRFSYKGEDFIVESREEYPFISAKCTMRPNKYENGLLFTNFEVVECPDDTELIQQKPIIIVNYE